MNYNNKSKKMGRPIVWPEPNTDMAKRLQSVLPQIGMATIGRDFFGGLSDVGMKSILSGATEPPPSALIAIAEKCSCDLLWLMTGEKRCEEMQKTPPKAGIEKSSRMATLTASAMKLQEHLNGIHRSALEGVITEDHFQEILDSAMDSIEKAVRRGKSTQKTTA